MSRHDLLSWGNGVRSESLHHRLTQAIDDEMVDRELQSDLMQLEQWRAVQVTNRRTAITTHSPVVVS